MDATYKKVEIVGTSSECLTKAIENAIGKCAGSIENMGWFEVVEQRGRVVDGKVTQYQVTLKVGFRVE